MAKPSITLDLKADKAQFIPEDIPLPAKPKRIRVHLPPSLYRGRPPYAEPPKPNQAAPVTNDWTFDRTYRTGDGDTPTARRTGSDHAHLKSHGWRT